MHTFLYIYVSILTVLDSKGTMTRLERPGLRGALGATLWNLDSILQEIGDPQKNIYFCFIDYAKAFDCVDHNKLWKILKEMGILDNLTCLWEIFMQVKTQQLEQDMEKQTGSKMGKEYISLLI